ncbi:MAG TPA: L,D-transpeptidase family protein [Sphingomonas sp.]|jgi:murein L,D-transpeptidase YcbB/YkuD
MAFLGAVALASGLVPAPAVAQSMVAASTVDLVNGLRAARIKSREVRGFYAARGFEPIWVENGVLGPAAQTLLDLIETSEIDGLDPDDFRPRALRSAIERAEDGSPRDLIAAELLLSQSFVAVARAQQAPVDVGMISADRELAPRQANAGALLEAAGAASSLTDHLADVRWMNPLYGKLRRAALASPGWAEGNAVAPTEWRVVRANLDRLRALPFDPGNRFILVDAAAARLWMYRDGKVAGTMRVVVGKPSEPTPMMAGLIRYASVNPYWNIPPDLVRIRVAPGAMAEGRQFLRTKGFEVLSDWSESAKVIDPESVNWADVAQGRVDARVRQRPGPNNAMGRIKFMFPNDAGIYLHDTPEKALLRESDRLFSSGCVRVEDAPRLAAWLFGKTVPLKGTAPEHRVDMPQPVPVYITYLTAAAETGGVTFRDDVYGRDQPGGERTLELARR